MKQKIKKFLNIIKQIGAEWSRSNASTYGASVAYYTIFSIAPLVITSIAIAGLFLEKASSQERIIEQFQSTFGTGGAEFIQTLIKSNATPETNILLIVVGFLVLLIGASAVFSQLRGALDKIFESPAAETKDSFLETIRKRFFSVGIVLAFGFLLFTSLLLSAVLTYIVEFFSLMTPLAKIIIQTLEVVISLGLVSLFLAVLYRFLPSKHISWKSALAGGIVAGALFTVSKILITFYIQYANVGSSYGAASSLVLIVMWVFYMSQVFFIGAIINKLYIIKKIHPVREERVHLKKEQ